MARDLILSAYASAAESQAGLQVQPLGSFTDRPAIVQIPLTSGGSIPGGFAKSVQKAGGTVEGCIQRYSPADIRGEEVRRVALVTFSAGYGAAKKLLTSGQGSKLDACIFVDSLAIDRLPNGELWVNPQYEAFLKAAAIGGPTAPLIVSSCARIPSLSKLVGSTADSTQWLLDKARAWRSEAGAVARARFDDACANAPLGEPVTIEGGNPPTAQTWDSWPAARIESVGNIVGLFFGDSGGPAHIFQAWRVQPRLFSCYLAPWWSIPEMCQAGDDGGPSEVSACKAQGVSLGYTIPAASGATRAPSRAAGGIALGLALLLGVAVAKRK